MNDKSTTPENAISWRHVSKVTHSAAKQSVTELLARHQQESIANEK